ncbi:MAG: DUF1684 domain-containing protein [Actinomycetota bacterium]
MSGQPSQMALADFRARVADLYHRVRVDGPSARSWAAWRAGRDELFRTHPCSPLAGHPDLDRTPFWPYDPSWRLLGTVTAADGASVEVQPAPGVVERFDRIGTVSVARDGASHALPLYWSAGYSGGLFLPFRDATTGRETFGAGRYLLDGAKSADLGRDGDRLILDFNFAYHPSCVWGQWLCPLPVPEAVLPMAVTVGERCPVDEPAPGAG